MMRTIITAFLIVASPLLNAADAKSPEKLYAIVTESGNGVDARFSRLKGIYLPIIKTKDYWGAYQENEVAADARFKGKAFVLRGSISKISKNISDDVILHFYGDKYGSKAVQAQLFHQQACGTMNKGTICRVENKAASLKINQKVDMDCFGTGMFVGIPTANECIIRPPQ